MKYTSTAYLKYMHTFVSSSPELLVIHGLLDQVQNFGGQGSRGHGVCLRVHLVSLRQHEHYVAHIQCNTNIVHTITRSES